jgi:hypothetical protein
MRKTSGRRKHSKKRSSAEGSSKCRYKRKVDANEERKAQQQNGNGN